jgi:anti-sigma B factor antagonist
MMLRRGAQRAADVRSGAKGLARLMNPHFTVHPFDKYSVVEFRTASLMDPMLLEEIGRELYRLVDDEDRRKLVLDFEKVQYLSSQAIGIILTLNKKLGALKNSKLVLCGVGPKLMELLKITRLDRILTVKPTQEDAVKVFTAPL